MRPSWMPPVRDMTWLMARVREIMAQHQGRKAAIRASELARLLGEDEDRRVRLAIEELRKIGVAIGSATEGGAGYFLIVTPEEKRECLGHLRGRRAELDKTIEALERATAHIPEIRQEAFAL